MDDRPNSTPPLPQPERTLVVFLLLVLTPLLFAVFNTHGAVHVLALAGGVAWLAAMIAVLVRQRRRRNGS